MQGNAVKKCSTEVDSTSLDITDQTFIKTFLVFLCNLTEQNNIPQPSVPRFNIIKKIGSILLNITL